MTIANLLLLLVAAEFVGADSGIGYRIWWSWSVFWVETMYVGFAVIAFHVKSRARRGMGVPGIDGSAMTMLQGQKGSQRQLACAIASRASGF